jgi:anti-sigma-K factor RskA
MVPPPPHEPDVAAAELALGLLDGDERAAALRRLLAEPAFAREVERWRQHFSVLFASVPSVEPRPELGERVMARLDGPAPPARANYWKPFALASSLAAASLLAVVVTQPAPSPAPPVVVAAAPAPMVAAFMIEGFKAPLVARYDARHGKLSMPGPMPIPAGKSAQLWAIVGEAPPHPLGLLLEAGARVEADADMGAPMPEGVTFAISIEPAGGSPTGLPTGPVVGSATLTRA